MGGDNIKLAKLDNVASMIDAKANTLSEHERIVVEHDIVDYETILGIDKYR